METMTTEDPREVSPDEIAPAFVETVEPEDRPAPRAPQKRAQQKREAPPARPLDAVEREFDTIDATELRDQILALAGSSQVKVTISRKAPRLAPDGTNVLGVLESVEDVIDHDYIREHWGGGTFSLMIQKLHADGRYKILRRIQLQLAGPPKMNGQVLDGRTPVAPMSPTGSRDPIVQMAFESSLERERRTEQRLFDAERESRQNHGGLDPHAVQGLVQPYVTQISALMKTVNDLQQKLADLGNKPPPVDGFRDNLMTSIISGDRSEADRVRKLYEDRLETQRDRYESRMDDMLRAHRDDLKRAEDRGNDMLRQAEVRHERELKALDKQNDFGSKNADVAFQARLDAQKETISRLERELTQAMSKIGTLEAKKDQSIAEKADELLKVQEAIEGLGGGGEKDEKWWSKLMDIAGNSEAAMALVNRFTGGPPEQQQQPQVVVQQPAQTQLPPPGVPWKGPDGNVYVQDGAGNIHQLDPAKVQQAEARLKKKKKKAAKAAKAAAAAKANGMAAGSQAPVAEAAEPEVEGDAELEALLDDDDDDDGTPTRPTGRPPNPDELKAALIFMENAARSGAPPERFASTVQSTVPADILAWIMAFEKVDDFLNQVKLAPGSPLTTVAGRNFARAVHKVLKEGSTA